jgi:hypothetical protein
LWSIVVDLFILAQYTSSVDFKDFELVGKLQPTEIIAKGHGIHELAQLRAEFGAGNWRKMKGHAQVRLANGEIHLAEIHWYEAHGIGKRKLKIKCLLD